MFIGFVAHNLLDADRPEDFHRPLVDLRGARMDRCSPMVFDGERTNTVMAQQQRRRKSDETAPNNQNGYFDISHHSLVMTRRSPGVSGFSARSIDEATT